MGLRVVHAKVSDIPDDPGGGFVKPSDWNADHTIEGAGSAAEADVGDFATAAQGAFATKALAAAFTPATAPDWIRTEGHTAAGDGGGALYKKAASEPSHDGKFSISAGGTVWYELAEVAPNEVMFGGVTTASNATRTAAIQSLLTYCAVTPLKKAHIVNSHTITSKITIPANVDIEGNAAFGRSLTKGFSGDMFDVNGGSQIYNLGLAGAGATYTGRGFHVIDGNDQIFHRVRAEDFAGACIEYDNGEGIRSKVKDCFLQRTTITDPAIVYPATDASSTGRRIESVDTGGGTLANLGGVDNIGIFDCDCTNIVFTSSTKKAKVVGNRIANGAIPVTVDVLGTDHSFVGNIFSGAVTIGGTTIRFDDSNIVAAGSLSDTSGGATNFIDIPVQSYTPTWKGDSSDPSLGDGTISGNWARKGKKITQSVYLTMGSTTTYGTGNWYFQLVFGTAVKNRVTNQVIGFDNGTAFRVGAAVISSTSSPKIYMISNDGTNNWAPSRPHTWASGDYLYFTIEYELA